MPVFSPQQIHTTFPMLRGSAALERLSGRMDDRTAALRITQRFTAVRPAHVPDNQDFIGSQKAAIKGQLSDVLGMKAPKSEAMSQNLSQSLIGREIGASLRNRLTADNDVGRKGLKDALHYSAFQRGRPNAEQRLWMRGEMLRAFALGASVEQIGTMRKFFDGLPGPSRQALPSMIADRGVGDAAWTRLHGATTDDRQSLAKLLANPNDPPPSTAEHRKLHGAIMHGFSQGESLADLGRLNAYVRGSNETERGVLLAASVPHAELPRSAAERESAFTYLTAETYKSQLAEACVKARKQIEPDLPRYDVDTRAPSAVGDREMGIRAISAYTGGAYNDMNAKLRRQNPMTEPARLAIDLAASSLKAMPDYKGFVVRSIGVESKNLGTFLSGYPVGTVVKEPAFFSSSSTRKFDGNINYIVASKHGKSVKDISLTGGEGEVLFPPGTQFKVLDIRNGPATDSHILIFEEIE